MWLTAAVMLTIAAAGCGEEDGPALDAVEAARERIMQGNEMVDDADGGYFMYGVAAFEGSERVASSCAAIHTEPSSVAENRSTVTFGTYVEEAAGTCALGSASFIADGATVYVPTEEQPEGRYWWIHDRAQANPDVLAEVRDAAIAAPPDYDAIVDAASEIVDNSVSVRLEFDAEGLVGAGLIAEDEVPENAAGSMRFVFADDGALSEVESTIEGGGTSVERLSRFEDLNQPQDITIPEEPFLNPPSARIDTVEQFEKFVGLTDLSTTTPREAMGW